MFSVNARIAISCKQTHGSHWDVYLVDGFDNFVLLLDVYRGPGLADVPRSMVKALRRIGYTFTFHGLGGEPDGVRLKRH